MVEEQGHFLSGDVALRAVSAMAAAVVFDAVARQTTDNIPSVLAQASTAGGIRESQETVVFKIFRSMVVNDGQRRRLVCIVILLLVCTNLRFMLNCADLTSPWQALGQRLGLGQGCFASETSEQAPVASDFHKQE